MDLVEFLGSFVCFCSGVSVAHFIEPQGINGHKRPVPGAPMQRYTAGEPGKVHSNGSGTGPCASNGYCSPICPAGGGSIFGENLFIEKHGVQGESDRHVAKRSSDPREAYPEVKVQVRDLVRVVGIVAPFALRGSVFGENSFYRAPVEETCAGCLVLSRNPGYKTRVSAMWLNVVLTSGSLARSQSSSVGASCGYCCPPLPRRESVFGGNSFYRVPGCILAQKTCAGCPQQRYTTGEPGKSQGQDRVGIVEGSWGYQTQRVSVRGKFVLLRNPGYKTLGVAMWLNVVLTPG